MKYRQYRYLTHFCWRSKHQSQHIHNILEARPGSVPRITLSVCTPKHMQHIIIYHFYIFLPEFLPEIPVPRRLLGILHLAFLNSTVHNTYNDYNVYLCDPVRMKVLAPAGFDVPWGQLSRHRRNWQRFLEGWQT